MKGSSQKSLHQNQKVYFKITVLPATIVALFPVLHQNYRHLQYELCAVCTASNDRCGMRTGNEATTIGSSYEFFSREIGWAVKI